MDVRVPCVTAPKQMQKKKKKKSHQMEKTGYMWSIRKTKAGIRYSMQHCLLSVKPM